MAIRHFIQILCDVCEKPYNTNPAIDDPVLSPIESIDCTLLRAAELDGWLVQRLARDISYGSALCDYCKGLSK